jgi:hypothetical protein
MANLYHYSALRGAELCSGKHGKCTMASAADHYTSWEAADAQRAITPPRRRGTEEHTLPERITWSLVEAMAMVFADEVTVSSSAYGVTYGLKSGKIPYQEPFEQLRSEKYVEIAPKRREEDHHRLSPTPQGMLRLQDARILGALHTWAETHGVQLTLPEAQELFNRYRAKVPVVFSTVLSTKTMGEAPAAFFADLRSVVTNLLQLERTTLRQETSAAALHGSYMVERADAAAATITPYPDSGAFAITWKTTSGGGVDAGWSFPVDSPEDGLRRYLSWALAHPLIATTRR